MKKIIFIISLLTNVCFGQIVVTSKGTGQNKAGTSLSVAATFTTGSSVIVCVAWTVASTKTVTLRDVSNTIIRTLTTDVDNLGNANVGLYIASCHNLTSGEAASITQVVEATSGSNRFRAMTVYQVTGLDVASTFDQPASSSGSSGTPNSTNTPTTSNSSELIVGAVGINGPDGDTPGTWNGTTTDNDQRLGTTGAGATSNVTINSAVKVVSSTGTYNASKTGMTSRQWGASVATYKATVVAHSRRINWIINP